MSAETAKEKQTTQERPHKILGIDLGTTMSCIAGVLNGDISVIDNKEGERVTPSVVCLDAIDGSPVVGSAAILAAASNPTNFVYEAKRMIGRGYYDPDVMHARKNWSFSIKEYYSDERKRNQVETNSCDSTFNRETQVDNIGIPVKIKGKEHVLLPVEISTHILSYLMDSAQQRLGTYPSYVVITVPAYFLEPSIRATKAAAEVAFGSKVDENNKPINVEILTITEPTAAAMAYASLKMKSGTLQKGDVKERVMVFDMGGGTFDLSVLDISYVDQSPIIATKGIDGNAFLGGADFDNKIMEIARAKYVSEQNAILANKAAANPSFKYTPLSVETIYDSFPKEDREEMSKRCEIRLKQEAVKVKAALSTSLRATFSLSCYIGSNDLTFTISRAQFERSIRDILEKIKERCKGAMLNTQRVPPIYDTQGMLLINETCKRGGHTPSEIEEKIEKGKAMIEKIIMVGGSSRVPIVRQTVDEFFKGKNASADVPSKVVSPLNEDEAIAVGAAYCANSTKPEKGFENQQSMLLVESTPLALSVEVLGGMSEVIIEANSTIPARGEKMFTTAKDNQTDVHIKVLQGNMARAAENRVLGEVQLSGIPAVPKGKPQISVVFEISHEGVLSVHAEELSSHAKAHATMTNHNIDAAVLERMLENAKANNELDKVWREVYEFKRLYEAELYAMEEKAKTAAISDEVKNGISMKIETEINWLARDEKGITMDSIKSRKETFMLDIKNMLGGQEGSPSTGGVQDSAEVSEFKRSYEADLHSLKEKIVSARFSDDAKTEINMKIDSEIAWLSSGVSVSIDSIKSRKEDFMVDIKDILSNQLTTSNKYNEDVDKLLNDMKSMFSGKK